MSTLKITTLYLLQIIKQHSGLIHSDTLAFYLGKPGLVTLWENEYKGSSQGGLLLQGEASSCLFHYCFQGRNNGQLRDITSPCLTWRDFRGQVSLCSLVVHISNNWNTGCLQALCEYKLQFSNTVFWKSYRQSLVRLNFSTIINRQTLLYVLVSHRNGKSY